MKEIFNKLNIFYIHQKRIGRRWVDFYLPQKNLVIECDGAYWHGRPGAKEKDEKKDIYLKERGYKIKRLSEKRIKQLSAVHNITIL